LKWKDSLQLCDFSPNVEESNFYHSHSMKTKPYLSLRIYLYFFAKNSFFPSRNDQGLFISFPICIHSPREFLCSPWRVEVSSLVGLCHVIMGVLAALARFPSNFTRHGEQTCASAYFLPLITRHGE